MNEYGIEVIGTSELIAMAEDQENSLLEVPEEPSFDALTGFILSEFNNNLDAKRQRTEQEILESLRAYNGEYSQEELAILKATGSSDIFMEIPATKVRVAASWIKDVLLPARGKSWSLKPAPLPDLPDEIEAKIQMAMKSEFEAVVVAPKATTEEAQESIKETNQKARDIREAIQDEIQKEALFQLQPIETAIDTAFHKGSFYTALNDFIDDFCIFPTAFLKGPIVTKKKTLTYQNGKAVADDSFIFYNKRVSPLDMYPAPEAESVQDGNLCEHMRLSKAELAALRGVPGYSTEAINAILASEPVATWVPNTYIEEEKADEERKGTSTYANRNIFHSLHFHGSVSGDKLIDWGMEGVDASGVYEVEALLVADKVVKVSLNDDPLLRRPYYSASYQTRPGSIWGRGIPQLIKGSYRMCNATVRSLSNNMGISSGPQAMVKVDLLADDTEVGNLVPFQVHQVVSDQAGSGEPITFFQPRSNANEFLGVYKEFELRADEACGVPKVSHGNAERAGLPPTAQGLAMILETASKQIKDAIRNIDSNVLIPRVEYQFYWTVTQSKINYSGDINVVALGSAAIINESAQQIKRAEFLQITANPIDQKIMGVEGRSVLIGAVADDLGFTESIVPNRLEQKTRAKKEAEAQQAAQQQEMQAKEHEAKLNTMAAEAQVQGNITIAEGNKQIKLLEMQLKNENDKQKNALKAAEIEAYREGNQYQTMQRQSSSMQNDATKKEMQNKELAVKIQTGSGI